MLLFFVQLYAVSDDVHAVFHRNRRCMGHIYEVALAPYLAISALLTALSFRSNSGHAQRAMRAGRAFRFARHAPYILSVLSAAALLLACGSLRRTLFI
jgi:hypothetical protein